MRLLEKYSFCKFWRKHLELIFAKFSTRPMMLNSNNVFPILEAAEIVKNFHWPKIRQDRLSDFGSKWKKDNNVDRFALNLYLFGFRVCSLHFSNGSYERDVEHELLGLVPRSRLRRGAVPDEHVPVVVPSLINKLYSAPPPPRNVAPHRAKPKKLAAVKPPPRRPPPPPHTETPPPDEAAQMVLLNALGLQPRNNNLWPTLEALGSVQQKFLFTKSKIFKQPL